MMPGQMVNKKKPGEDEPCGERKSFLKKIAPVDSFQPTHPIFALLFPSEVGVPTDRYMV